MAIGTYTGQTQYGPNGEILGQDPTGAWKQIYNYTDPAFSRWYNANNYEGGSSGSGYNAYLTNVGIDPSTGTWFDPSAPKPTDLGGDGQSYYFAGDPNMPQGASPWTHTDPSGFGWNLLSTGVPLGLGAIGLGAAGAFGAAGAATPAASSSGGLMGLDAGAGTAAAGGTAAGGGAAGAGTAAAAGGGMDALDIFGSTAGAPGWLPDAGATPFLDSGAPVLDMFGSTADTPGWLSDASAWGGGGMSLPSLSDIGNFAKNIPGLLGSLYNKVSPYLPSAQQVGSTVPGALALAYAANQPGLDLTNLNSVYGKLGGNQDAIVKAATDPLQMNIAGGYGDLLQSQGLRGIRGSSFGTTDIANYLSQTGNTLANAGANAAQGSLALQGNLAAQIAQLQNQAQQQKNDLYGRAFDTLGRGLNPRGYSGFTVNS